MHRIHMTDGTWRQSRFLRGTRSVCYLSIASAGTLLAFSPLEEVYGVFGDVMMWFLVIGGLCAAFGSVTCRWVGEFVGIPLISPAFAVLGVLIWDQGYSVAPFVATANLLLLLSFACMLLARWRVVLAVFRFAERHTPPRTVKRA